MGAHGKVKGTKGVELVLQGSVRAHARVCAAALYGHSRGAAVFIDRRAPRGRPRERVAFESSVGVACVAAGVTWMSRTTSAPGLREIRTRP